MIQQHRRDVLSLTTSLVTPLNLMTGGGDSSVAKPPLADDVATPLIPVAELPLLVGALVTSGPLLSDVLVLDWARCFLRLARVVPASDWSRLLVSAGA